MSVPDYTRKGLLDYGVVNYKQLQLQQMQSVSSVSHQKTVDSMFAAMVMASNDVSIFIEMPCHSQGLAAFFIW